jgi:hypothetical protein
VSNRCHSLFPPVAVALALSLAACGGSTNKAAPTSSTGSASTVAPASSSSTTTPVDPTKAAMKAGLLRASDLPAEWKDSGESSASGSDQTQIDVAKTIPSCRGFAQTVERENRQPKSSSNKFVDSTATPAGQSEVSNDVVAWPTVADAKAAYGVYSAGGMTSCLDALFRKIVAQQAADSGLRVTISVEKLPAPAVGDAAIAYEAVVSLTSGSTSRQLGFVIQIVRVSRFTVSYNATLYKDAPTGFGKNLVVRSIARLEAAPSS